MSVVQETRSAPTPDSPRLLYGFGQYVPEGVKLSTLSDLVQNRKPEELKRLHGTYIDIKNGPFGRELGLHLPEALVGQLGLESKQWTMFFYLDSISPIFAGNGTDEGPLTIDDADATIVFGRTISDERQVTLDAIEVTGVGRDSSGQKRIIDISYDPSKGTGKFFPRRHDLVRCGVSVSEDDELFAIGNSVFEKRLELRHIAPLLPESASHPLQDTGIVTRAMRDAVPTHTRILVAAPEIRHYNLMKMSNELYFINRHSPYAYKTLDMNPIYFRAQSPLYEEGFRIQLNWDGAPETRRGQPYAITLSQTHPRYVQESTIKPWSVQIPTKLEQVLPRNA